jgi:myo-inositol-1-phosphate synthase
LDSFVKGNTLGKIRVAIAGLGSCASALVQGVEYYRKEKEGKIPGLMHNDFGGYFVDDIQFVAAFDVNKFKIGKDVSEAIFENPNVCEKFAHVPLTGVKVLPGPISDGVAPHMIESFHVSPDHEPVDVVEALKQCKADMLINYLPVGSANGTHIYAESSIEARCAFINCIPEFIASVREWGKRFEKAGLPVAGDDIKSQVGATILHRAVAELFYDRGVQIDSTYQLNIGGNTDFQNMTVEERLKTKRVSKTEAITSLIPYTFPTRIGPSDYVPFLQDKKICYIRVNGYGFGNLPITFDAKLVVNDSPNSGGVVIDVIRAIKLALDRSISGPLLSISSYAFKHPPEPVNDEIARRWVEEFIQGKREK